MIYDFILRICFSHFHAEASTSRIGVSAFHPRILLAFSGAAHTCSTNYIEIARKNDGYYYIVGAKNGVSVTSGTSKMITIGQKTSGDVENTNPCGGKDSKVASSGTVMIPYTALSTSNLEKSTSTASTTGTAYPQIGGSSSQVWSWKLYASWIE